MTKFRKTILAAATAGALGFASAANAGVVIDLFSAYEGSFQRVQTETLNATVNDQDGPLATTSVIGGYRDLSIKKTGDASGNVDLGLSSLLVDSGNLSLSNETGNSATGVVTWDGSNDAGNLGTSIDIDGLGGVDLTVGGSDRFLTEVFLADLGFNYQIIVWDMDGDSSTLSATVQFQVNPDNAPIFADYLFAWFNLASGNYCDGASSPPACADPSTQLDFSITRGGNGNAIDFTRIGALQLVLWNDPSNAQTVSADFSIGTIETVPEPGVLALVGIGLLGAAVARRRARASVS